MTTSLSRIGFGSAMLCALLALLFISTSSASAHTIGASFESPSGEYLSDIGYDTITFDAGQSVRFDFNLKQKTTKDPVPFDQVWIRIVHNGDTLLATGIHQQVIGPTTLLFTFPEGGDYTLESSYRTGDEGDEIASSTFPISVSSTTSSTNWLLELGIFALGLCFGAGGLYLVKRAGLRF